jgi:hypothetical protein
MRELRRKWKEFERLYYARKLKPSYELTFRSFMDWLDDCELRHEASK